jgi:hypothetical protein
MKGPLPSNPRLSPDAGYGYRMVHDDLAFRKLADRIAERGAKTPVQANGR